MTTIPDPSRQLPGRFHRHGPATEREAAARVMPRSGTQRYAVLVELRLRGERGATDYELFAEAKIGARPHVPGTRREELIADGHPIVDSGERRLTDTGARAIVWKLGALPPAEAPGRVSADGSGPSMTPGRSEGADPSPPGAGHAAEPHGCPAPPLFEPDEFLSRKPAWA